MRRRRQDPPPVLDLSIMDVMCHGWEEWKARCAANGTEYGWPALLEVPRDDWPALYAAHRDEIEAEARRRGLSCSWASSGFTTTDDSHTKADQ